jgi:RNA polymerase sigma factor (sigma-70 family)
VKKETDLQLVMDEYTDLLFRIAYYYTKDKLIAEDIVQEVFVKFYYSEHYEEQNKLRAYLTKMTANKSKDYLKSWAYQKIKLTEKLPFALSKDTHEINYASTPLEDAVLALPVKFKEVITYYYYEGFSIKEIAQIVKVNENTIKSRMKKAKALLRVMVGQSEEVRMLEQVTNETLRTNEG